MAGLKYGFLGVGLGGTSIASACASIRTSVKNNMQPYSAFLVNTNEVDMNKIPDASNVTKFLLKGYEKGAGRDIDLGEEAFLTHKETLIEKIQSHFSDRDYVFLMVGMGGGTGTGAVIEAAKLLHANGFHRRFSLVLTLPRDQEGKVVLDNAIQRLQLIARAMKGLGSIILVDNQQLFENYLQHNSNGSVEEFLKSCNEYIAVMLHEMNTVTSSYNPTGPFHFDTSEWLKILQTPGIMLVGRTTLDERSVDAENEGTFLPKLKQSIEEGVLSGGYNLENAERCALSLLASPSGAKRIFTIGMMNTLEQLLITYAPYANERPVATYGDQTIKQLHIYSVFAGLSLPNRVLQIIESSKKLERKNEVVDEAWAVLQNYSVVTKKTNDDLETLLGTSTAKRDTEKLTNVRDPFDFN
ncbi:plasmid replication protein [Paenibacillus xylanilyticus]|uniref:Plasmid replication protein n=1 Tax=Paenibacillus xylanilyticus TaxID=248903 RepID=A0A7Y6BUH7_9BACL|nr:plasmid replication protein [Paenibacillus xylanilyticus]NUU74671.1 plasmid replication protein [Paenibacillus xylanilyticus]